MGPMGARGVDREGPGVSVSHDPNPDLEWVATSRPIGLRIGMGLLQ